MVLLIECRGADAPIAPAPSATEIIPEMPKIEMPDMPDFEMPEMPELPKFSLPSFSAPEPEATPAPAAPAGQSAAERVCLLLSTLVVANFPIVVSSYE